MLDKGRPALPCPPGAPDTLGKALGLLSQDAQKPLEFPGLD